MDYIVMWVGINNVPHIRHGYRFTYHLIYNSICEDVVWVVVMKGANNGN